MLRIALVLLTLTACSRPLTDAERAFAGTIHGPSLDASAVRIHGRNPLYLLRHSRDARPPVACRERIRPPETGRVQTRIAATVLYNRAFFAKPFFLDDYLSAYPSRMSLPDAMLLAHELTHVWQWQNAEKTGYTPFKAATEHVEDDPYLFDLPDGAAFADYGYEQQGGLVEEFVCCRALDPDGARTAKLYGLLSPVFPALERRSRVPADEVLLPQGHGNLSDICG
ncbi:hypothetical protein PARPLA_01140 [Rhodobacteraceae bacterium THAF1]|uniref:hypothetical protein n=1 Tax=Palleronia sp. THAF1 TaxID=2587842 RepID=UPI000F403FB4|nr:hypothetical protein [Palleronia sp. THAF1]QFU07337.1 hypothetical protein FIU81_01480 [Palleronia sp. THAF1]VDC20751.1 hypothetical protein PARPLA_01140 [Rhodobacteraceae bacterium THAF1]